MSFFNTLLEFVQDFIESIFASSSPELNKKHQIKQLTLTLKAIEPPIYRSEGILLPAFPASLHQINQFLQPIKETFTATLENTDHRIAERYNDYLIELILTEQQRALRKSFTFSERNTALSTQNISPELIIEEQGKQFNQYLKILDSSIIQQIGILLEKLDALIAFCQFDFNNFCSYFDPAFAPHSGKNTTVESPSFHTVEVAEIILVLLDFYYVQTQVELNSAVIDMVSILEAKKNKVALSDEIKNRTNKIFQAVSYLLQKRLNKDIILSIIRIAKDDPNFIPEQPVLKTDHIMQYKMRITEIFHSDSRKLLKDGQQNVIQTLINATFGNTKIEDISGYSEETNRILQEFTLFSFEWIKPIQLIKTFAIHFFEPHYTQFFRSVIVEGYFNNRTLQGSLAASYYYCESVSQKIEEFEQLFTDNQSFSTKILTGYITEIEKGVDFEKPLRKMVENINNHAKKLIQQTVSQYAEVLNLSVLIQEDNKKALPEAITNIRNLTISTKNAESFAWLEKETRLFRNFLEIMKNYAIVGTLSVSTTLIEQTEN